MNKNRTFSPTRMAKIAVHCLLDLNSVQKLCGTSFSQFLLLYVILGPTWLWESYSCRPPLIYPAGYVAVGASGKPLISWEKLRNWETRVLHLSNLKIDPKEVKHVDEYWCILCGNHRQLNLVCGRISEFCVIFPRYQGFARSTSCYATCWRN